MTLKQRRSILFIALAGTAAWSFWLAFNEPAKEADADLVAVVKPTAHAYRSSPKDIGTTPAMVQTKRQEDEPRLALAHANLFAVQTWFIPPPPPPPPPYVPPPPPLAPELPFSYMGRWQEAGQTTYYLARGTLPVSVHAGQILDGVWRLEPVNGGMLNFIYLPLNQTRSLRTGD